jgi:hypothetical protein
VGGSCPPVGLQVVAVGFLPEFWKSYWFWVSLAAVIGLISWLAAPAKKQCPVCGQWINQKATICPFCGHGF